MAALHRLGTASLRALAASMRGGMLSGGIQRPGVQQAVGPAATEVERSLRQLHGEAGLTLRQIALMLDAMADARESRPEPSELFDLVLSGPELPAVPVSDTGALVQSLMSGAQREVLLVTYAIHNGPRLFAPLAQRMLAIPDLKVTFVVNIGRDSGDTTTTGDIVRRYAAQFKAQQWPWEQRPVLLYDRRSLEPSAEGTVSMHAKCLIVDRLKALITSANFTDAAQRRNIEAGILLKYRPSVERLASYFEGLRNVGLLQEFWLPE